jgi:hypothetical protein
MFHSQRTLGGSCLSGEPQYLLQSDLRILERKSILVQSFILVMKLRVQRTEMTNPLSQYNYSVLNIDVCQLDKRGKSYIQ